MPSTPKTYDDLSISSVHPATTAMTEPVLVSELRKHQQFLFSAMGDEVYNDFGNMSADFEDALNAGININDYTQVVRKIHVIPLIFAREKTIHEGYIGFKAKSGEVILQPLLDPEALAQATVATYPTLLADVLYEKGQCLAVLPEPLLARMREVLKAVRP